MSMGVNKVILIGRVTFSPEKKVTQSGTDVCKFSLAVDRRKKEGQDKPATDFINIVAWGKLAQICGDYLKKGQLTYIEGSLQVRVWEKEEGDKRRMYEVHAKDMQMLGGKPKSSDDDEEEYDENQANYGYTNEKASMNNDDIPF